MNTCKNCIFFERKISESAFLKWGSCKSPYFGFMKEDEDTVEGFPINLPNNNASLSINDCLGEWEAKVGENFGCVNYDFGIEDLKRTIKELETEIDILKQ